MRQSAIVRVTDPTAVDWRNPENVKTLKKLFYDNVPRREIARHFNCTINVIAGKTHRLGLKRPPEDTRGLLFGQAARLVRQGKQKAAKKVEAAKKAEAIVVPVVKAEPAPTPAPTAKKSPKPVDVSNARPWLERKLHECAFPIDSGDRPADTLSCCAKVAPGSFYCEGHLGVMYDERRPSGTRPTYAIRSRA